MCDLIVDCEHKTASTEPSGYPSIRTPNIGRGYFILDGVNRVSEETYKLWTRRAVPQPGDLIMAREAPVGNVAVVPEGLEPCLGQRTLLIRPKEESVDSRFLAYLLLAPTVQSTIHALTNGATVPHLNMEDVRTLAIPQLPPLRRQQELSKILGAYDDLVENNLNRIRILEEMARVLYREWFVELMAPGVSAAKGDDVPAGWRFVKLASIADVNRAQINTKIPPDRVLYIDISSVGPGIIREVSDLAFAEAPGRARRIVQHGDILWSCVRPNRRSHVLVLSPEPDTVASTGFAVLTATKVPFTFLYQATTTDAFVAYLANHATGAAYPAVTAKTFEDAEILLPPADLLERFAQVTTPMAELIANLHRQNLNLRATRDLLLPRLMSGQLSLADVNDLAHTATTIENTAAV